MPAAIEARAVSYHVTSKDEERAARAAETLQSHGYDVVDTDDGDAVVVVLGGDGSILHAARTYDEPTILPVRTGTSKGHRTSLDEADLVAAVETIETGTEGTDYRVETHHHLRAESEAVDLPVGFTALNDICLHHRDPTMAAEFAVRLHTDVDAREFEELIGDGLVVATPFGSSAYFRSITGRTFENGLGVAFNNVHWPGDAPAYVRLPSDAHVEVAVTETTNAAAAVLTRDNHPDYVTLEPGAPVTIRQSDEATALIRLDP